LLSEEYGGLASDLSARVGGGVGGLLHGGRLAGGGGAEGKPGRETGHREEVAHVGGGGLARRGSGGRTQGTPVCSDWRPSAWGGGGGGTRKQGAVKGRARGAGPPCLARGSGLR